MKFKLIISYFILLFILVSCSSSETVNDDEQKLISEKVITNSNNDSGVYLKVNFLPESIARYLVREQLANLDFPIDAIGETNEINGSISLDKNGNVISEKSIIVVNVNSLKSDNGRRDRYISRKSLETNTYPEVKIVVTKIENLTWPISKNGTGEIIIIGDMTAHGVTDQVAWNTTLNFNDNNIEGLAKTNFKFDKFEMDIPRVAIVLSVDDNIRLELDFNAEIIYLE
ncbi:MAG: hypothetical protein CL762_04920 [Chloroflexi bacterium]|nr:hypothetical protein [Chloroflexota bacterium]|tara:strand:- start:3855 stop:4538 length:684 start_codon:yes stop_codon:yes gene_type:complete